MRTSYQWNDGWAGVLMLMAQDSRTPCGVETKSRWTGMSWTAMLGTLYEPACAMPEGLATSEMAVLSIGRWSCAAALWMAWTAEIPGVGGAGLAAWSPSPGTKLPP